MFVIQFGPLEKRDEKFMNWQKLLPLKKTPKRLANPFFTHKLRLVYKTNVYVSDTKKNRS